MSYQTKKYSKTQRRNKSLEALESVELKDKANEFPSSLSGSEQQRVALARAIVGKPQLIICDEPTGALDNSTGEKVLSLLHKRVKETKSSLILVTHDKDVAATCNHIYKMNAER